MFEVLFSILDQTTTVLNQDISGIIKKTREQIITKMLKGYLLNEQFTVSGYVISEKLKLMDGFSNYFLQACPDPYNSGEAEPYVNFEHEPDVIVQIKKFINLLYHVEIVVAEAEKHKNFNSAKSGAIKVKDTAQEIISLWSAGSVDRAYKAIQLVLQLDFEFIKLFTADYSTLYGFLTNLTAQNERLPALFPAIIDATTHASLPSVHQLGEIAGTVLKHMQPDTKKIDYHFLTRFSAILPGYIQDATSYISECVKDITTQEPTLNKANIKALEDDAIKLLNSINSAQGSSSILLALNFINYIHIIRHVITLSNSTMQQIGLLSETSQKTISDNIATIKKSIAIIEGVADKIEDGLLLAPGTLSKPLSDKLTTFYQTLIFYVQKTTVLGPLSTLNDPEFVDKRLEETKLRIQESERIIVQAKKVKVALTGFFKFLEDINNGLTAKQKNIRLIDLDLKAKAHLLNDYVIIQPYVQKYSDTLDREIVHDLTTAWKAIDQTQYFLNQGMSIASQAPAALKGAIAQVPSVLGQAPQATGALLSQASTTAWSFASQFPGKLWSAFYKQPILNTAALTDALQAPDSLAEPVVIDELNGTAEAALSLESNNTIEATERAVSQEPNTLVDEPPVIRSPDIITPSILTQAQSNYQTFIPDLASKKNILLKAIESEISTQNMHIINNTRIIDYVNSITPRVLCPYPNKLNKFNIQEEQALKLYPLLTIPSEKTTLECKKRIIFSEPVDADKSMVRSFKEVLIIHIGGEYKLGFCNTHGDYAQRKIDNRTLKFLTTYTATQYIETKEHVEGINQLVTSLKHTKIDDPTFGGALTIRNPKASLTSVQLYHIYRYYHGLQVQMSSALDAYTKFKALLCRKANEDEMTEVCLDDFTTSEKQTLKALYLLFQPWFISALPQTPETLALDNTFIHGFNAKYNVDWMPIDRLEYAMEWMPKNRVEKSIKLKENTLYIEKIGNEIHYSLLDPSGIEKTGVINEKKLTTTFADPLKLEQLQATLSEWLKTDTKLKENTLYLAKVDNVFKYLVIDPFGIEKAGIINKKELNHKFKLPLTINQLKVALPKLLEITTKNHHTHPDPEDSIIDLEDLVNFETCFIQKMKSASHFCEEKEKAFKRMADDKFTDEIDQRDINKPYDPSYRIDQLIKKNQFSKKIKLLSNSLYKELSHYLNTSIMENLVPKTGDSPFPELENSVISALQESHKCCRLIYSKPSELDEKQVTASEEILIVFNEADNTYQIGYNKNKKYKQLAIKDTNILRLLKPYTDNRATFITTPEHINQLNKIATMLEKKHQSTPTTTAPLFAQNKQLSNAKRLFNALYNLEKIFERVENSNNLLTSFSKGTYLIPFIQAIIHTKFLLDSLEDLQNDPHLAFLANGLISKFLSIKQELYELVRPYSDEPPVDGPKAPGDLKLNPLWYTLHGFMLLPRHILSAYTQKPLTPVDMEAIKNHTKKIGVVLERVINKSDSYFKLLLETPAMYSLFKELKGKLTSFMATLYSVGAEEKRQLLEKLHDEWFTDILIKADRYESEWGLNSELLSNNLNTLFDAFYKGLLEPFDLPSKRHLACITSLKPFEERIKANNTLQLETQINLSINQGKREKLIQIITTMDDFKTKQIANATPLALNTIKAHFNLDYDAAYPILSAAIHTQKDGFNARILSKEPVDVDKSRVMSLNEMILIHIGDTFKLGFCNKLGQYEDVLIKDPATLKLLNDYKPGQSINNQKQINQIFNSIEGGNFNDYFDAGKLYPEPSKKPDTTITSSGILEAAKKTLAYYDRLIFAYQLEHKVAVRKGTELNELETKQKKINKQYVLDYIESTFEKNLTLLIERQLPPPCVKKDYNELLKQHLIAASKKIKQDAQSSNDIDLAINKALVTKVAEFESLHLAHYKQLNAIITSLNQFRDGYATAVQEKITRTTKKSSLFENATTLRNKTACVEVLLDLTNLPNTTPGERIKQLQNKIDPRNNFSDKEPQTFKTVMLTYNQFDSISFAMLQRWLLSLLAAIHLYTPQPVKHYNKIAFTVMNSTDIKPPRRLHHFFTQKDKPQRLPLPPLEGVRPQ
jgi:hypothetical protein